MRYLYCVRFTRRSSRLTKIYSADPSSQSDDSDSVEDRKRSATDTDDLKSAFGMSALFLPASPTTPHRFHFPLSPLRLPLAACELSFAFTRRCLSACPRHRPHEPENPGLVCYLLSSGKISALKSPSPSSLLSVLPLLRSTPSSLCVTFRFFFHLPTTSSSPVSLLLGDSVCARDLI